MAKTVAILGASGFVGSTLVEYLQPLDGFDVTAFSHSTGGASCLAHKGLIFEQLDVLDRKSVERALQGFDYVVNCSRGGPEVMLDGLDNLLGAAKKAGVSQFVHLSSVAVYGDPPHPESTTESAPAQPGETGYGAVKLAQDNKVQSAANKGLGAVALCPPNIIGPYSGYVMDVVRSIESGEFALLDGGSTIVNLVDVNNLCAAIVSAMQSDVHDGRRLFICERDVVTWGEFCEALRPIVRNDIAIPSLGAADFAASKPPSAATGPAPASGNAVKHLISDEVREALRRHRTWASIEGTAKDAVRKVGGKVENYMRKAAGGVINVPTARPIEPRNTALISQQLRKIRHSPERAFTEIGFEPPYSFSESMAAFRSWYVEFMDADSAEWTLLGEAAKP